jgi:hypothetical protein
MARGPEDLLYLTLDLSAGISLDMERIEEDPIYHQTVAMEPDKELALQAYLEHYLIRDRLLREMPSTNGPGHLALVKWTGYSDASSGS